ncbi:MAG: class I SAM-dependent methyltransferase [Vulcanimicrobiaceae bacterium]
MAQSETERFTGFASRYDKGRPGYPPEVVDRILDGLDVDAAALKVADLGAGTGMSARLFTERGARVFAIEPNAAMRAKGAALPGIAWLDGTAEHTGLEPHSIDVAIAFQAFHWFDPGATFAEIERVLRPGGRAAVAFYERDERDAFTKAYGDVIRRFATDDTEQKRMRALEAFESWQGWSTVDKSVVAGEQILDAAGFDDRIASTSYLPHSGPQAKEVRVAMDAVFKEHARNGRVRLVLQTVLVIAEPKR